MIFKNKIISKISLVLVPQFFLQEALILAFVTVISLGVILKYAQDDSWTSRYFEVRPIDILKGFSTAKFNNYLLIFILPF